MEKGGTLDKELHDAGIDVSKQSFSKRREHIPPRKGASKGYKQLHANSLYDIRRGVHQLIVESPAVWYNVREINRNIALHYSLSGRIAVRADELIWG